MLPLGACHLTARTPGNGSTPLPGHFRDAISCVLGSLLRCASGSSPSRLHACFGGSSSSTSSSSWTLFSTFAPGNTTARVLVAAWGRCVAVFPFTACFTAAIPPSRRSSNPPLTLIKRNACPRPIVPLTHRSLDPSLPPLMRPAQVPGRRRRAGDGPGQGCADIPHFMVPAGPRERHPLRHPRPRRRQ